jgi:hypothetical protein
MGIGFTCMVKEGKAQSKIRSRGRLGAVSRDGLVASRRSKSSVNPEGADSVPKICCATTIHVLVFCLVKVRDLHMYCDTCISALLFGGVISYLVFLTLLEF